MFKLLGKVIFTIILVGLILVGISVFWGGGEKFRWFGKKVGHFSEIAAVEADKLKAKSDKLLKSFRKTEDKKDSADKKDEKSH